MLAVMNAGVAFTLLDASQPRGRLEAMVRELGADIRLISPTNGKLSLSLSMRMVFLNQTEAWRIQTGAALSTTLDVLD